MKAFDKQPGSDKRAATRQASPQFGPHRPLNDRPGLASLTRGLTEPDPSLAAPLMPKLTISSPNDPLEREADRMAEAVLRGDSLPVRVPAAQGTAVGLDAGIEAPPIVHQVLATPGEPLNAATRAFFEPRFGHDLSHVRVHADARAAESAAAVKALAYTVGRDVVVARRPDAGWKNPGTGVLAHELAHVQQQESQVRVMRVTPDVDPSAEIQEHTSQTSMTVKELQWIDHLPPSARSQIDVIGKSAKPAHSHSAIVKSS